MKVLIKKSSKNSAPKGFHRFPPSKIFWQTGAVETARECCVARAHFCWCGVHGTNASRVVVCFLGLVGMMDGWWMLFFEGCWDVFFWVVSDHFSNRFCEPLQMSFWVKLAAAKAPENWCLEDECPFGAYFQGVKLGLRKKKQNITNTTTNVRWPAWCKLKLLAVAVVCRKVVFAYFCEGLGCGASDFNQESCGPDFDTGLLAIAMLNLTEYI